MLSNNIRRIYGGPRQPDILIEKKNYDYMTTNGIFEINPVLGDGTVQFSTTNIPYSNSYTWGPQKLFDNRVDGYDWAPLLDPSTGYKLDATFTFSRQTEFTSAVIIPRNGSESLPINTEIFVDGNLIVPSVVRSNYTYDESAKYFHFGFYAYYLKFNAIGNTLKFVFQYPQISYAGIGEMELYGNIL